MSLDPRADRPRRRDNGRPVPHGPAVPPQTLPAEAGPAPTFSELGVPAAIAATLAKSGVATPFPIQAATLPDGLAGRDILGRAQTGSGKTIAFAVPLVTRLLASDYHRSAGRPGGLVLVPTRELAAQVTRTVRLLTDAANLQCLTIHGGVPQGPQVAVLRRGVDIVVATPGRLEDLVSQHHCRLDAIRIVVLDEADLMADLGFLPAVKRLLDRTPSKGQRLLFSATLDDAVRVLAERYLRDPATHSVDPLDASPSQLEHHLFTVQTAHKAAVVTELASGAGRSLLFTRTKHGARKLAGQLNATGIPAVELHSNLSQRARERNLAAFAGGAVRVLVATDIAARGIHIDDVSLVVHVDPPAEHKAYLHRSGRTARAGATGVVVTVATHEQARDVNALVRKAKIRMHTADVAPGDGRTTTLTGPPAERRPRSAPSSVTEAKASAQLNRPGSPNQRRRPPQPRQGRSGRAGGSRHDQLRPRRP